MADKQNRVKQADADCSKHKEIIKLAMSKRRALKSDIDALKRKEANKVAMSQKRALESDITALKQRHANKVAMSIKRTQTVTIDDVIKSFCEVIKRGPAYVCTICHHYNVQAVCISISIRQICRQVLILKC